MENYSPSFNPELKATEDDATEVGERFAHLKWLPSGHRMEMEDDEARFWRYVQGRNRDDMKTVLKKMYRHEQFSVA